MTPVLPTPRVVELAGAQPVAHVVSPRARGGGPGEPGVERACPAGGDRDGRRRLPRAGPEHAQAADGKRDAVGLPETGDADMPVAARIGELDIGVRAAAIVVAGVVNGRPGRAVP